MTETSTAPAVPTNEEIEQIINAATQQDVRNLSVEVDTDRMTITIEGKTSSFYYKQSAQKKIISMYSPPYEIKNNLVVS